MILLDLFCGAGGASVGYARAGWDVHGVDIDAQPHYPFPFWQADAMSFPLDDYDAVHASPPCHDHTPLGAIAGDDGSGWMLQAVLARLQELQVPWVIENVQGAWWQMPGHVRYCGSSFGLGVRRHRLFTSNRTLVAPACRHKDQPEPFGVYGTGGSTGRRAAGTKAAAAMGVDWTRTRTELAQMVPPAYTCHIGQQLLSARKQPSVLQMGPHRKEPLDGHTESR